MSNSDKYSILVNSSDGYQDCWAPFFTLLDRYWPECDVSVILNTQRIVWGYPQREKLFCTCIESNCSRSLTWSECLLAALNLLTTPIVLYFQEDYFLDKTVNAERINQAVSYMLQNPEISHIGLTKHGSRGPFIDSKYPGLLLIDQKARYRISTQVGLWRVDALKSYINPAENGWMFEIFGTWRAQKRDDIFLTMPFNKLDGGPCVDYLHTGIIKGQWLPQIQDVFIKNGIELDFSKRGFYRPKNIFFRKIETARRLLQNSRHLFSQLLKK